jgi:hypothetical protein
LTSHVLGRREEAGMPTPEQNMETVSTFAREVFGNKDLDYASAWLADDFVEHQVFPGTTPAIRATYRGTDKGGFIPGMPATGRAFEMDAM